MRTLLFFVLPSRVAAQPCICLAYDGFDYAPNTLLEARPGGAGWANPWLVQNNDVAYCRVIRPAPVR